MTDVVVVERTPKSAFGVRLAAASVRLLLTPSRIQNTHTTPTRRKEAGKKGAQGTDSGEFVAVAVASYYLTILPA